MLSKQIENAQRKVEEQNYLIRKRVLEYDDVMNQQREIVYKYRDEVLEGRDMGSVAREQVAEVIARLVDEYTPGDYIEEWDLEGMWVAARPDLPRRLRPRGARPRVDRPRRAQAAADRGLAQALRRARGGARRGADARARALPAAADDRPALARAPLRHGLPARGHPPPRLRPDRPARRLQERGLLALPGPDEHHLVGLRAHDLQRRSRGGGRERAVRGRRPARTPPATPRSPTRAARSTTSRAPTAARATASRTRSPSPPFVEQRRLDENEQIGRNDPCWCGSGKKFKKCHGA